jgi:hypothetical protein
MAKRRQHGKYDISGIGIEILRSIREDPFFTHDQHYAKTVANLLRNGCIVKTEEGYRLTEKGLDIAENGVVSKKSSGGHGESRIAFHTSNNLFETNRDDRIALYRRGIFPWGDIISIQNNISATVKGLERFMRKEGSL